MTDKYGIFLKDQGDTEKRIIMAVKATTATPVDADWDSQDTANSPRLSGGNILSMWAFMEGDPGESPGPDIHVVTQQVGAVGVPVAYHLFSTSSDTWTITNEFVDTGGSEVFITLAGVSLAVDSTGDVIVVLTEGDGSDNIIARRRTGGSWGGQIIVSSSGENPVAIGPDTSDRITFIWFNDPSGEDIETRSLSSSDVLGTQVDVDIDNSGGGSVLGPGVITSGNEIYIPYGDADNTVSVANWTSAADPTGDITLQTGISDNTVLGVPSASPPFFVAGLALDGTDVHLLYANTLGDLLHDADVDGGGETDTDLSNSGEFATRISFNKGITELLYFYEDNESITKYGTIVLAAPPFPIPPLALKSRIHTVRA